MKRTGAILLSFILTGVMTVTNMVVGGGISHCLTGMVYAAELNEDAGSSDEPDALNSIDSTDGDVQTEQGGQSEEAQAATNRLRVPALKSENQTYTLTFQNKSGHATGNDYTVDLSVAQSGDTVCYTLPEDTRFTANDDYYFAYWTYKSRQYLPGSQIDVDGSAVIYAEFLEKPREKLYIANNQAFATGGNGYEVELYKLPSEKTVSYTLHSFEETGFKPHADCDFIGWQYRDNNTLYQPGEVIQIYKTSSAGQSDGFGTLFATFGRRQTYTVSFKAAIFQYYGVDFLCIDIPADKITKGGTPSGSGSGTGTTGGSTTWPGTIEQMKRYVALGYFPVAYNDYRTVFGYNQDTLWNRYQNIPDYRVLLGYAPVSLWRY